MNESLVFRISLALKWREGDGSATKEGEVGGRGWYGSSTQWGRVLG